jgi:hypothetical protein
MQFWISGYRTILSINLKQLGPENWHTCTSDGGLIDIGSVVIFYITLCLLGFEKWHIYAHKMSLEYDIENRHFKSMKNDPEKVFWKFEVNQMCGSL